MKIIPLYFTLNAIHCMQTSKKIRKKNNKKTVNSYVNDRLANRRGVMLC